MNLEVALNPKHKSPKPQVLRSMVIDIGPALMKAKETVNEGSDNRHKGTGSSKELREG